MLTHVGAHLGRGMSAALRYRGIESRPYSVRAQCAYGVAHGVLRRRKSPGGNFSLDPLGRIRRELNLHGSAPYFRFHLITRSRGNPGSPEDRRRTLGQVGSAFGSPRRATTSLAVSVCTTSPFWLSVSLRMS